MFFSKLEMIYNFKWFIVGESFGNDFIFLICFIILRKVFFKDL